MISPQPERRQYLRIKFSGKVHIVNAYTDNGIISNVVAEAINVSETGMMIQFSRPLKYGSLAIIYFTLPNTLKQRIDAETKVVWNTPSGREGIYNIGLQFVGIESLKQTFIRTFIMSQVYGGG